MDFKYETEVEPTLTIGLKLWWAWFWRFVVTLILTVVGFGWVFSFAAGYVFGSGNEIYDITLGIIFYIMFVFVSAYTFRRLITKRFGKYRLVVMKKEFTTEKE